MFDRIQNHFQFQADQILTGQLKEVCRLYSYPMVIYLNALPVVVPNAATIFDRMTEMQAVMQSRGLHAYQSIVTAVQMPRKGRFRVWITSEQKYREAPLKRRSSMIHYMRDSVHGLQTEMIHVMSVSPQDVCNCLNPLRKLA